MLVRDQVLSLLSELKFLKKKTKRAKIKTRQLPRLALPHASYGSGLSVSFVNWALD